MAAPDTAYFVYRLPKGRSFADVAAMTAADRPNNLPPTDGPRRQKAWENGDAFLDRRTRFRRHPVDAHAVLVAAADVPNGNSPVTLWAKSEHGLRPLETFVESAEVMTQREIDTVQPLHRRAVDRVAALTTVTAKRASHARAQHGPSARRARQLVQQWGLPVAGAAAFLGVMGTSLTIAFSPAPNESSLGALDNQGDDYESPDSWAGVASTSRLPDEALSSGGVSVNNDRSGAVADFPQSGPAGWVQLSVGPATRGAAFSVEGRLLPVPGQTIPVEVSGQKITITTHSVAPTRGQRPRERTVPGTLKSYGSGPISGIEADVSSPVAQDGVDICYSGIATDTSTGVRGHFFECVSIDKTPGDGAIVSVDNPEDTSRGSAAVTL